MDLIVVVIIGLGVVALGVLGWNYWQERKILNPGIEKYEEFLKPFVFQAIISAYKLSEQALDETGKRIEGLDKKEVAKLVYDMLPDEIAGIPVQQIKLFIGQAGFERMIQSLFDETMDLMKDNRQKFDQAYRIWMSKNQGELE